MVHTSSIEPNSDEKLAQTAPAITLAFLSTITGFAVDSLCPLFYLCLV